MVTLFGPTDNTPGYETGYLSDRILLALFRLQDSRTILIFQTALVGISGIEFPRRIEDIDDLAWKGDPIDMNIKDIHEDGNLVDMVLGKTVIKDFFHKDDLAISG